MPFPLLVDPDHATYDFPAHRVYARDAWGAPWTLVPYLSANWLYFGCAPEPSRAELAWRYGTAVQPGTAAAADYAPLDLMNWYIKVEIDQQDAAGNPADPILWHGLVSEIGDAQFGAGPSVAPLGSQALVCHGLEVLLDRSYIAASWCLQSDGSELRIGRGLQFNADHDFLDATKSALERSSARFGNRSIANGPRLCKLFATELATAKLWTSWDIVSYLLAYFPPAGPDGQATIPWSLTSRAFDMIPDWDSPVLKADGLSVKKILDQLFDRRRLYSWRVVVEEDEPRLDVFCFSHTPIVLPSGAIQPANPDVAALSYDLAVDVQRADLKESSLHRAERIVCRGARKRACFTIAEADGTLEGDWKADDETAYEAGPTGLDGLDGVEKETRIRNWRREERLKRVFCYFRIPRDWDRQVGNGEGGDWKKPYFPDDDEHGPETIYWPEAKLARELVPGLIEAAPTDSPEDCLQPQAWIWVRETGGQAVYQHIERIRMSRITAMLHNLPLIDFSCTLRPYEIGLGVIVKVQGGGHWGQEAIAKTDFNRVETGIVDLIPPPLDWREMAVTVAMDLDSRVEGAWPPIEEFQGQVLDVARVLVLDMGDRYRLDYVAPQTVKGVEDGRLVRDDLGGYYRDDRPRLADIARLIYEWYSRDRKALSLALRDIVVPAEIGTIVSSVNRAGEQLDVFTPVTSIHIDLVSGMTTMQTDFAELDPNQVAGDPFKAPAGNKKI